MLLEQRQVIEDRKAAARKWIAAYATQTVNRQEASRVARALVVLVMDLRTSDYLAEFDPMGLKQAQESLNNLSWANFMDGLSPVL